MSTHQMDASGSRALSLTINDSVRTAAIIPAKQGDDIVISLGNFEYVEIPVPATAGACELIKRVRTVKKIKRDESGNEIRDTSRNIIYEDVLEEQICLRLCAFAYISGHTKKGEYPQTPHTNFRIVNLENEPNKPVWLSGEITSEEKVDLGFGTE